MRSTPDDSLTDLVSVRRRLGELPVRVEAQPEFRDGLRAMLMATIEREGIGATATEPEPEPVRQGGLRALRRPAGSRPAVSRRLRTRGAIVVGLAAGALAVSGMSAASDNAVPGDALYLVKRSSEKAQLALTASDISKGQLYLEFARTRLGEAQAVKDPAGLSSVLDDMDGETLKGVRLLTSTSVARGDTAALDAIDGFVTDQRAAAEKLRASAGGEARTRATKSVTLLDEIDRRSKALRPLVKCGPTAVTTPDTLGPAPVGNACRPVNKSGGTGSSGQPQPGAPVTNHPGQNGERPATTGPSSVSADPSATESAPTAPSASAPAPPSPTPTKSAKGGLLDWLLH
ncbi:DUF5667 domain-containing protein [Dactylosporangium sp. NPDC051484]|uniref:DUF5667 domain-containing protein n=1 Tax=Dactylosporangium sp. NPDC051484 TaxID=3154942 RepID=UPI003450BE76